MSEKLKYNIFSSSNLIKAIKSSFIKLSPKYQIKNPVMFVVYVGSIFTTILFINSFIHPTAEKPLFIGLISLWLWITILFANFAESIAEGRGKAQADNLKQARKEIIAKKLSSLTDRTKFKNISADHLRIGDLVLVEAGDFIPGDGTVLQGVASVDESAITGESAPVIRENGGDRDSVTGGTRVLSDWLIIKIASNPGEMFIDKMINLVEGAKRQKTPNEIALSILLAGMTIIFLGVTASLMPFSIYGVETYGKGTVISLTILVSLLVCLIPTTIGGLLSAIGIAGMNRLMNANVIAMSGRAVEAAGDVNILLMDKTGTITYGNRQAVNFIPADGVKENQLAEGSLLSSLADDTPEGKSIVQLAYSKYSIKKVELDSLNATFIPFKAESRTSGIKLGDRQILKGSGDAIERHIKTLGGTVPESVNKAVEVIAKQGGTPLIVCDGSKVLGTIHLKDVIKAGIKERLQSLREMGIKSIMITGDNPLTAMAIATEAGVDDFLAQATPEDKLKLIREKQRGGELVAMVGDGTNDAPALAQSDVAVVMNSGTQAAKEAGNMIDMDSDPTKLIEIVEIGKQLLMTRGALTTFSIANDVAKYFAIIPAAFVATYPQLSILNIMNLTSPSSAILSAIIFNALIIIFLVPLALKGVKYRPLGADKILTRHALIYGLGGLIVPFIGIKALDILISTIGVAI
ncbi:MAG: potassium-transporting ATPase subunit KdpB [Alphaproteobacteria bacterium]|jgi:K+-transporting ATPase ATPase B chain